MQSNNQLPSLKRQAQILQFINIILFMVGFYRVLYGDFINGFIFLTTGSGGVFIIGSPKDY